MVSWKKSDLAHFFAHDIDLKHPYQVIEI